jgi:tRNA nucleotidyltransferase (CCA-adding enzyme)
MDLRSDDINRIDQRLHFHAKLLEALLAAAALFGDLPSLAEKMKPSQCVIRLEELPLTAVFAVFLCIPDGHARRNLNDFLETWRHVKPITDGYALKKRGLPTGPRYRQILSRLRQAWLDEEIKNEAQELELLDRLIKLE